MPTNNTSYDIISAKISSMKSTYTSLRTKSDDYVFSALCIKSNLYKNPALVFYEKDFDDMIVDGQYDGGVDILTSDPNSENSDLIIAQSKFYTSITREDVSNALTKMAIFYNDMLQGHYEEVNEKVQRRFLTLNSEVGEESKIRFIFYTSAPQSRINKPQMEKKFLEQFSNPDKIELSILFGSDIEEEIKEAESRRPSVEFGKIRIDRPGNYLTYGDDAVIVNVSSFSIKKLYAQHNINLLSKNLRYHVPGVEIDKGINNTIQNDSRLFWYKNNGITIVCDSFNIDGKEIQLRNFSIINGGQTTYMLHKSDRIDEDNDFYLPCKIIKATGETENDKNIFCLEIAKAANTQKPIKPVDLKANSPEQVRFAQAMREVGIFYQTKRGEQVPTAYKETYLNSSLAEIGKLGLAAIFQLPCQSRTKPSLLYAPQYYNVIFSENPVQTAKLSRELLYIDYYFRNIYQKKFDRENNNMPDANERIAFAHNSRTICIAFVAFASRYYQKNIRHQDLQTIFATACSEAASNSEILSSIFRNINGIQYFLPPTLFNQKDEYDTVLDKLFTTIINAGVISFSMASRYDPKLTATNFLKKEKYYYVILSDHWASLSRDIDEILKPIM